MNRIETNLQQRLTTPESSSVLESLLEIKIGGKDEFDRIGRYETRGMIYMNKARDIWLNMVRPTGKGERAVFSKIRVNDIKIEDESNKESDLLNLNKIIIGVENYGLEPCKPEAVFYVALRMLESESFGDEVFVLSKIEDKDRVFVIERDNDGDVSVDLYDDYLVNKGSGFDKDEKFLFALSDEWNDVDVVLG
jgi:hypothetical protein